MAGAMCSRASPGQKELRKEKALMDGIKAVMPADAKQRWTANMDAQEQRENAAARSKQE